MLKIAVIVPEFPSVTQSFTYSRLSSLAINGENLILFYTKRGDFSLLNTNLLKRFLSAGVNYSKLPAEPLKPTEFLRIFMNKNFLKNFRSTLRFLIPNLIKKNIKRVFYAYLRFAPIIFWRPDIIHIEASYLALGMIESLEFFNIPIVISLRGADVDQKPYASKKWINFFKDSKNHPLLKFHCVSQHVQQKAIELGIPVDKCKIIYQGVFVDHYEVEQFNVELKKIKRIVIVARLSQEKGVDIAIQSLRILHDNNLPLELEIIGDGNQREELQTLVAQSNLQDHVMFLGAKENDWVLNYLKAKAEDSLYLQPSRFEAFGHSILEAMISGLPIVAACVGGIPEIINDGENGLLFEVENPISMAYQISKIVQNENLRRLLRINAVRICRDRFNEKIETEKFISYYSSLC